MPPFKGFSSTSICTAKEHSLQHPGYEPRTQSCCVKIKPINEFKNSCQSGGNNGCPCPENTFLEETSGGSVTTDPQDGVCAQFPQMAQEATTVPQMGTILARYRSGKGCQAQTECTPFLSPLPFSTGDYTGLRQTI